MRQGPDHERQLRSSDFILMARRATPHSHFQLQVSFTLASNFHVSALVMLQAPLHQPPFYLLNSTCFPRPWGHSMPGSYGICDNPTTLITLDRMEPIIHLVSNPTLSSVANPHLHPLLLQRISLAQNSCLMYKNDSY